MKKKKKKKTDVDSLKKDHKGFIKNKLTLKTQQKVKSERHNVFTEKIVNIAWNSNDDKRMQSIDLIETYAYRTTKDLLSRKEEIQCNNIIKQCKKD